MEIESILYIPAPLFGHFLILFTQGWFVRSLIENDLIIYCFTSHSRNFYLYGDVTIADEGLQNLDQCSALRAFEQGGIFIVPHLWNGDYLPFEEDLNNLEFPLSKDGLY
jgi:hypothetical protein